MAKTETGALIPALREVLRQNALLEQAGVFLHRAPREDALPYVLVSVAPRHALHRLNGKSGQWARVTVKACSTAEGMPEADELLGEVQVLLREGWDGRGFKELLNEQMGPEWEVDEPIHGAPLPLYDDEIVQGVTRWHMGLQFDVLIRHVAGE